jgi:AcrR family transcriptional regulator
LSHSFGKRKMEPKEQILKGATELFLRYGIKSITMDDIARHLSVSKKTIYQYYEDKDALVADVTQCEMSTQKCDIENIANSSMDVIEEMMKTSEYLRSMVSRINPSLLFDMRKYHPSAWKVFQEHKKGNIGKSMVASLQKGIKEGYFRKDLNIEVLTLMRLEEIEMVFNPDVFPHDKFNIVDVNMTLFDHFLYGISTLKGHKRLNEIKQIQD